MIGNVDRGARLAWLAWARLVVFTNTDEQSSGHDGVADITIIHFLLVRTNLAPSLSTDTAGPDGCNINTSQAGQTFLPPHGKYSILEDN